MTRYPRIRVFAESGSLLIREAIGVSFYVRRPHREIAYQVMASLEMYAREAGPLLGRYADAEGEWQQLDAAGWAYVRKWLLDMPRTTVSLTDESGRERRYRFEYEGNSPEMEYFPSDMCGMSFWFPIEYLEEHGPGHMRATALELLGPLPICSGTVGPVYNAAADLIGVDRVLNRFRSRYPGIDLPDEVDLSRLGTRVPGPAWMTFLGQPTLGEVGGVAGLRARLREPGTTVEELTGDRAVVTLGPWPETGDNEQGKELPAHRELARALEPWLYREERPHWRGHFDSVEDLRRWKRRFLD